VTSQGCCDVVAYQVGRARGAMLLSLGLFFHLQRARWLHRAAPGPFVGHWARSDWWEKAEDHLRSSVKVVLASAGKNSN